MIRKFLKETIYKAGYVKRVELIYGKQFGTTDHKMISYYNPSGHYIGGKREIKYLIKKRGIAPELADPTHNVCSIGFSRKDGKWYGWSHRAIHGFGIGYIVTKGSCCNTSGCIDSYLAEHPEKDKTLPIGFVAKTIEDCKRCAIAFAESVS